MNKVIKVLKAMSWTLDQVVTGLGITALGLILLFSYQNECDVTKVGGNITVQCESRS